ncbi:hypothetical protein D1007_37668 [Hordeum vulgare]|nr:hypothetical protein D1007_37668 [Hordeum vulgare]
MPSRISKAEDLGPVLLFMDADTNAWGVTAIWTGSAVPSSLVRTAYPFFLHSIYAGLVPPFSDFFHAIFAFYCEAFVGMRPLVALFLHFFSMAFTAQGQCFTCISFVDIVGVGTHLKDGKKVEGYQNH